MFRHVGLSETVKEHFVVDDSLDPDPPCLSKDIMLPEKVPVDRIQAKK
jgi:hypothetical protein